MRFARTTIKNVRIDIDLLEQIEEIMNQHQWNNFSEFLRSAIKIFIRLEKAKSFMNDPEKWRKFKAEMDAQLSEENIFQYISSVDDSKLEGFKLAIEMEKENRI